MTLSILTSIQCTAFFNHFCLTKGNSLCCIEIIINEVKGDAGRSYVFKKICLLFIRTLFVQSLVNPAIMVYLSKGQLIS